MATTVRFEDNMVSPKVKTNHLHIRNNWGYVVEHQRREVISKSLEIPSPQVVVRYQYREGASIDSHAIHLSGVFCRRPWGQSVARLGTDEHSSKGSPVKWACKGTGDAHVPDKPPPCLLKTFIKTVGKLSRIGRWRKSTPHTAAAHPYQFFCRKEKDMWKFKMCISMCKNLWAHFTEENRDVYVQDPAK